MTSEGVRYFRFLVRYVTSDGKRRRKVLWCPGQAWIRETVDRWVYQDEVDVKPGSNVIVSQA